jgi:lipid-binding SYLF domain-containing protein
MKKISVALLVLMATAAWAQSGARSADIDRVQSAATILSQIMDAPDRGIPDSIMSGAKCIAIIPSMMKVGFILGANYGKGVATCRTATGWSSPAFFRVEGGSFGFQAGGQASDLVLIIRTDDGMQHLLQSKFKLGADASAAAGPVGRDTQAATDLTMRAQVLTYSRARGLFLGVSLSGAVIRQNDCDVRAFYGKDWTFYSLLSGEVPPPQEAQNFLKTVEHYAPTPRALAPAVATTPAPPAAPAAAPVTPAESTSSAAPAVAPAPAPTDEPVSAPAATADPTVSATPATQPVKTPPAMPIVAPTSTLPADPAGSGNKQP